MTLGKPKLTMPEPSLPHRLQPTITGTTVGSLDPSAVVVIYVFVVHSGWVETVIGLKLIGGRVRVAVTAPLSVWVAVLKGVEMVRLPLSDGGESVVWARMECLEVSPGFCGARRLKTSIRVR